MMSRSRTLRLDIAPNIYEALEIEAEAIDAGVSDVVRRILVQWVRANPAPADSAKLL